MKAAVFYGKHDIRIEERPKPTAGKGQMVVKIDYCGVCGTDVEAYNYEIIKPVIVLGHENVATIVEIGEGVEGGWKVGDRVLCGPPSFCADNCQACRAGKPNICETGFPRTAGIGGPDGGYEEYMLLADANHTMIVKVPDGVDPKDAVLFDVICVSLHALRKSNFRLGDNVVISGVGPIGLAAIQFAKAAGARKVVALGTNSAKFPLLKEYGADACINSKEAGDDLGRQIREAIGNPYGADVVLECAGNQASLLSCIFHACKNGGQVVMVGQIGAPLDKLVGAQFGPREIDLISSFVYTPEEIEMYLSMLADKKISFPGMVTDIIALDDVVEKGVARKPEPGKLSLKTLIDPSL